jgi:transcriptional regulator with XRE-family HTH domain
MTALRQAREARGWSQAKLIAELELCAKQRKVRLPGHGNLKSQISRWENGRVTPGDLYRELFRAVYRRTDEDLGFTPIRPPGHALAAEMLAKITTAKTAGPASAESFAAQVDTIRVLDRQLGAPTALSQLRAVTQSVEQLLSHAILPSIREPLAAVLADAATLAGWQALDLGDIDQAWKMHETAKHAAREAGDAPALAHAMGQQAYVLLDAGTPTDAVQLVRAAQAITYRQAPRVLTSWLSAAEAEACAAAFDERGMRRALDHAAAVLPEGAELSVLPYLALDEAHLARWRGNVLARLGNADAIADLNRGLDGMDPTFTRARASLECDLAHALIARGEPVAARKHVVQARQLAQQTGSVRQRRRIDALSLAA